MPLTRKVPLKRKTEMKRGGFVSTHSKGLKRNKVWKRDRPLAKRSKKMQRQQAEYGPTQKAFLALPENRLCLLCVCRSVNVPLEDIKEGIQRLGGDGIERWLRRITPNVELRPATEVHHWAGRIGRLLCYTPFFIPSCYGCRLWPHAQTKEARRLGLLAPAEKFNVFPENSR